MKQDTFYAKTAFFLSLGFWIPLFNIGLTITSLYLAFQFFKLIRENPHEYAGVRYALAACILSITTLFATAIGIGLYAFQRLKCGSF